MARKKKSVDPVKAALANIEKQMGGDPDKPKIIRYGDNPEKETGLEVLSYGCPVIDAASNCGGVPRGKIVELFGEESSGKSYVSLKTIAATQKEGGVCLLIDAEQSLDPEWATKHGVDVDNLYVLSDSLTAEEMLNYINYVCKSGQFSLIVTDSVSALIPEAELKGEIGDQQVALLARTMSQALRKIVHSCAETKTTTIFINQVRDKPGVLFGDNTTTPGGRALKFYAHQRLKVMHGSRIKVTEDNEEKIIGKKAYVSFVKNKVAAPFGRAEIEIIWDSEALNPVVNLCRIAKEYNILKKHSGEIKLSKDVLGTEKLASMGQAKTYAEAADYLVKNNLVMTVAEMTLQEFDSDFTTDTIDPVVEELLTNKELIVSPLDGTTYQDVLDNADENIKGDAEKGDAEKGDAEKGDAEKDESEENAISQ